jgi:tetratricopeptide (TPR) repeat protein
VTASQDTLAEALEYHRAGRLDRAEQLYRRLLAVDPQHADALHLLGVLLDHSNRSEAAVGFLERAVAAPGASAVYHYSLGDAYRRTGRLQDAIGAYRRSAARNPNTPEVYDHLGATLTEAECFGEAVEAFNRALELRPGFAEALNNLGFVQLRRKEPAKAAACFERAIQARPDFAEAHNNLGVGLLKLCRRRDAEHAFRAAVRCRPGYVEAQRNLGRTVHELGRSEEALPHLQAAVRLDPAQGLSYAALGDALHSLGRVEEAERCCGTGVERDPGCPEVHFVYSQICLLRGDFERGWDEYEWRLRMWKPRPRKRRDGAPIPPWDGRPLAGRRLLLYGEQGLGDNLQFLRYARLIERAGGSLILEMPPRLAPLLRMSGFSGVYAEGSEIPDCDFALALPSLPRVFATAKASIPAAVPYLDVDRDLVEDWGMRIPKPGRVRVGLVWGGNPSFGADCRRSLPLAALRPLSEIPGLALFSLQRGPHADQIRAAGFPIVDLEPESNEITDTAAILRNLDLLITADTMPAHLAGALGTPVWTLLHRCPDWRWMLDTARSPWYPTMRLFRQPRTGDWESVIREVSGELRHEYSL